MEELQIDPVSLITHAALSSIAAGAMTFVESLISGMFIRPVINAMSKQISSMLTGGGMALNTLNTQQQGMFQFPFPPPVFFSVTPDGNISISIPAAEAMKFFMPLMPQQNAGGKEE